MNLEELISDILYEAKRGAYADYYTNMDIDQAARDMAEAFVKDNENLIENFVDEQLLRY